MNIEYITELKNKEYALVGANVVKINSIDVEDDDIQATSLFNEQTVSYSIKHSGMIPLTVEEKDKLVSTYNNEGYVGLLEYIYNNY